MSGVRYDICGIQRNGLRYVVVSKVSEKVYTLLSSADEVQVRSTFDLLVSLDGCGFCEVLHDVDGQLLVREGCRGTPPLVVGEMHS